MGLMRDFQPEKPAREGLAEVLASEVAMQAQRPATIDNLLCGFLLDHDP
jgi:hypothetical protein